MTAGSVLVCVYTQSLNNTLNVYAFNGDLDNMGRIFPVIPDKLEKKIREKFVRNKGDISKVVTKALQNILEET